MAERLTKRRLKEDKFVDTVNEVLAWARDNVALAILSVLGFVVLIVLAVRIGGSAAGGDDAGPRITGRELEAHRALVTAREAFLTGELESGRDALQNVAETYPSSRAGREAKYLLANTLYELGEYDQARAAFEEFLGKPVYEDLLADGARLAVGACHEELGNLAAATVAYRRVWDQGATPGVRIQGALAAARCAREQGLATEARTLYQAVADTFPDSPEAEDARFALLELGGASAS